jgi:hypothetical protein
MQCLSGWNVRRAGEHSGRCCYVDQAPLQSVNSCNERLFYYEQAWLLACLYHTKTPVQPQK